MYVIIWSGTDLEEMLTDVAAVVVQDAEVRLCRDGREDEWMPKGCCVVVTPEP